MLKEIYDKSPYFLQDLFLTLQALKYRNFRQGGKYKEILHFLRGSQNFSGEEMFKWQLKQFQLLFGEAYDQTEHYKKLFDSAGINPKKVKNFEFLEKLPILSKDLLRSDAEKFINKSRKIVYTAKTGGTTGAPLITPFDSESTQWAFALITRFFEQSGVKYGDRNLHMTGQQVVPINAKSRFWRRDFLGNSLYLSIHHLSPKNFSSYWQKITQFKPRYIFGYASFIYDLARLINENKLSGQLKLKGVFPSSEKLTVKMRSEMEIAFDCKVFDHYGSTEGIPLITQCKVGNYHIVPESGIIEFINKSGEKAKAGEYSEMIMTSLRQFSRPILRYKIGDTAVFSNEKCSCGLKWLMIQELSGRLSEWITLKDGRKISQFSHQVFKVISNVAESQIIQHDYDRFEVFVVKDKEFVEANEKQIFKRFSELIGNDFDLKINYVTEISKTNAGKKPSLISKIS